jgi:DNA polymerase elongation subunit (family B)
MKRMPVKISVNDTQEFQIIDWFDCDYTHKYSKDDIKNAKYDREHNKQYTIFAFGVNRRGESICCRINEYKPYFYIRIPEHYSSQQIDDMIAAFSTDNAEKQGKVPYDEVDNDIKFASLYYKSAVLSDDIEVVEREIFWKFMNKQKFRFLRISFHSKDALRFYYQYLKNPVDLDITDNYGEKYKYNLFEADFEPMLRFYHDQKVLPSGWATTSKFSIETEQSKCQINIACKWDEFKPLDRDEIAPLRIAAFDIEADSSHGDFPIAKKDCKKLANQLTIAWIRDLTTLTKEEKGSDKYLSAFARIQEEEEFFNKRIRQAVFDEDYKNLDPDIDYLYLKNVNNNNYDAEIRSKLASSKFTELCENIHYIVKNFKVGVKIKANKDMKAVLKTIQTTEEAHIEKHKRINWDDLQLIIEQTCRRNRNKVRTDLVYKKYITKDVMVRYINSLLNRFLGNVEGDRVIQIGTVFWTYGEQQCFHNNIITLQGCSDFLVGEEPCDIISHSYSKKTMADRAEKRVLLEWTKLIEEYDPDIIIGYNTFGFDMAFMYDRAVDLFDYDISQRFNPKYENDDYNEFINMGRLTEDIQQYCSGSKGRLINKKLSSSALGDNFLFYFNMPGRVQIDLLKVCQSSMTKLPSYKLDDVASFYISGKIVGFGEEEADEPGRSRFIKVKNINEIDDGNFVVITMTTTGQQLYDGAKIAIRNIDREAGILELEKSVPVNCLPNYPQWGLAKDDVSPKDIFRLQGGNDDDRAVVAKYCIQDCVLLIRLLKKLEVVPNNIGMSNVSLIPFCYIFLRGQGIKIFSLIVNECALEGYLLPTLDKVDPEEIELNSHNGYDNKCKDAFKNKKYDDGDVSKLKAGFQLSNDFNVIEMSEDSYEGAIVLKPKPDIYFEPVTVLDFSSLYPSEMIASDLSHDRIVEDDCWLGDEGISRLNELGYDVLDRSYDNYTWIDPKNKNKGKVKNGIKTVRYVQPRTGEKGLIPKVLMKLLSARKATKKRMKAEKDPFKQAILEGLQLAYKLTANSLYGQIGAKTSKIYKQEIAASTTAGGRENIYKARDFCLENNPGCDVVYGDSIPDYEYVSIAYLEKNGKYKHWSQPIGTVVKDYFNLKRKINDKTYYFSDKTKYYTLTDDGYTNIQCIMEHYTKHHIYKISTKHSSVCVTTDHSMILANGEPIKPINLNIGDKLLMTKLSIDDGVIVSIEDLGTYEGKVYDLTTENHHFQAGFGDIVVHNTDSVFVKLNLDYTLQPPPEDCPAIFERFGTPYKAPDREGVFAKGGTYPETKLDKIKRSLEIGFWIQEKLKADHIFRPPHDLEYEKVYYPLILITKKRYIGIKYEFDPEEGKKTSMGVVTKRRDNAPILKHIFIGVVDTLMKECDLYKAIDFVRDACIKMINDDFDLNMFVISKTLREYYKDPEAIAHKVLAMRMGERDPGNKPASNERIPYVYIKINEVPGIDYLQGDRIEHINYVREQGLQVDYEVYIKNQIMKPVSQIFELVVEMLPGFPYQKMGKQYYANMEYRFYEKFKGDLKKMEDKLREEKGKMVQKLIFGDLLQMADKKVNKINTVDNYFKPKNEKDDTNVDTTIDIRKSSNKPVIVKKKKKQASIASFFTTSKAKK